MQVVRFVLAVVLAAGILIPSGRSPARAQGSQCQDKIVIMLPGLGNRYADSVDLFKNIEPLFGDHYQKRIYYTYRVEGGPHDEIDTYQSLTRSVSALGNMVKQELARCSGATFALIGYSLGGAVAISFLANQAATPVGAAIKNLVTLDSPVNGSSRDTIQGWLKILDRQVENRYGGESGVDRLSSRFGSQAVEELINAYDHGRRDIIATDMRRISGRTTVRTIASSDDLVVPVGDAVVPGFEKILGLGNLFPLGLGDAGCILDIALCLGHGQVLDSPAVHDEIKLALGIEVSAKQTENSPNPTTRIETAAAVAGAPNFNLKVFIAGKPLMGHHFIIYPAVQNIAGEWTIASFETMKALAPFVVPRQVTTNPLFQAGTSINGEISAFLPPTSYMLFQYGRYKSGISYEQWSSQVRSEFAGNWGQRVSAGWALAPFAEAAVFTITPGQQVQITIQLSVLNVSVINSKGQAAVDMPVSVLCQTTDIVGKKVHDAARCGINSLSYAFTDNRGVAHIVLGAGRFIVCPDLTNGILDKCTFDVVVEPGETKEIRAPVASSRN